MPFTLLGNVQNAFAFSFIKKNGRNTKKPAQVKEF